VAEAGPRSGAGTTDRGCRSLARWGRGGWGTCNLGGCRKACTQTLRGGCRATKKNAKGMLRLSVREFSRTRASGDLPSMYQQTFRKLGGTLFGGRWPKKNSGSAKNKSEGPTNFVWGGAPQKSPGPLGRKAWAARLTSEKREILKERFYSGPPARVNAPGAREVEKKGTRRGRKKETSQNRQFSRKGDPL